MPRRQQRLWKGVVMAMAVAVGGLSILSCSSNQPPEPTPQQQIKGESDRFFDKMKQEERERASPAERPAP